MTAPFLLVSRQDAPGVSRANTHQSGGLIQWHVLCEQAVQNLYPSLFSLRQCHILHALTLTLASYR